MKTFRVFPDNAPFSNEVNRTIRYTPYGFGDFGEIFQICQSIDLADLETWYSAWKEMADRCKALGDAAWEDGRRLTASVKYKNASSYYRNAEFHLKPFDPRRAEVYADLQYTFARGVADDSPAPVAVQVPYEDTFLHGLYVPSPAAQAGERSPLVVCFGGLDSLKEEMYYMVGKAWPARGMSILAVDGPGQGATLRLNHKLARYDYEAAGTAVMDYLLTRADVDPARIGVCGLSLGGYYISRVAAFEPRYAAAVAWSGQYDYGKVWRNRPDDHEMADFIQWILGADSIADARKRVAAFKLTPDILAQVKAPFLVMHGKYDPLIPLEDAHSLYNDLVSSRQRTLMVFDETTLGVLHCQDDTGEVAVSNGGDWLAGVFGLPRR
jgi:dipeptidyl aminopeptidase/acylaminoacyl peptidase